VLLFRVVGRLGGQSVLQQYRVGTQRRSLVAVLVSVQVKDDDDDDDNTGKMLFVSVQVRMMTTTMIQAICCSSVYRYSAVSRRIM